MKTLPILLLLLSIFVGCASAAKCVTVYEKPEGMVWWFEPTNHYTPKDVVKNVKLEDCKSQIGNSPVHGSGLFVRANVRETFGDCWKYPMKNLGSNGFSDMAVNFSSRGIRDFIVKYEGDGQCNMKDLDKHMDGQKRVVPGSNPVRKLAIHKDPTYYNILLKYT